VGIILGPGQFTRDFAVIKQTQRREGRSIQFRTVFCSIFSRPRFANPPIQRAGGAPTSTFGRIIATSVNPRFIEISLKYDFQGGHLMKPSTAIAVIFLLLVSAGHLLRLIFRTQVAVDTVQIPMWASTAAFLFCAALAVWLWAQNRKRQP
jgi:hypothetical protein